MYILELQDKSGNMVEQRDIGHWRDHAREVFAGARRRLQQTDKPLRLILIDTDSNSVELEHNQTEGNNNG